MLKLLIIGKPQKWLILLKVEWKKVFSHHIYETFIVQSTFKNNPISSALELSELYPSSAGIGLQESIVYSITEKTC